MVETKIQQIGDVTVVEMSGRLDHGNSLSFAETSINRMIDSGTRKLVIDLARLDYIDSSGLGMLIFCGGHMERSGGRMDYDWRPNGLRVRLRPPLKSLKQ